MATVPRSPDSFTVAPTSLPGSRLTVPEFQDFGSAQMQRTGQALTAAGGAAQKAAMEAADEVNKIRINDAMNKAVAARMRLTYDDTDGFVNVKGERAVSWSKDKSLDQDYTERYQKEVDDIANSLGNEEQRKLFRASVGGEVNRFVGTVKGHLATELGNYEKGVRSSTIELAQNKGAKEWESPDSVSQSRRVIVNAINSDASLSPEQKADQTIKALSPMHAAVVAAALEKNNTSYAREYLKQFDTELTEDARLRLQKAVDIGDNRVKAQTFGDEMLDAGKTQVEAMAEARKRFTGAERDAAETRIKDIFGTLAQAEQRDKKALGDRGWSQIMTTGRLNATTEADLADKNPEELRQIRDWQEAKRNHNENKDSPEKFDHFYKLYRMAMEEPGTFVDIDMRRSQPYLTKSQLNTVVALQGSINRQEAKANDQVKLTKFALESVKAAAASVGIDLTPKEGSSGAVKTAAFLGALTQRLVEEQQSKDKPLTREEAKAIGMEMLREGIEQGSGIFGFFQSKKRGYQIATDPSIKPGTKFIASNYGDIPEDWRNSLAGEVREKYNLGTGPLNASQKAEVERMYTKAINDGRKLPQE